MLQNRPVGGIAACTFAALLCVANARRRHGLFRCDLLVDIGRENAGTGDTKENVRWLFISLLSRGFYRQLPCRANGDEKESRTHVVSRSICCREWNFQVTSRYARYWDTACDVALNFEYVRFRAVSRCSIYGKIIACKLQPDVSKWHIYTCVPLATSYFHQCRADFFFLSYNIFICKNCI